MKCKFTVTALQKLQPSESGRLYLYDTEEKGFGAMLTSTGALSFFVEYRHAGRTRRMKVLAPSEN